MNGNIYGYEEIIEDQKNGEDIFAEIVATNCTNDLTITIASSVCTFRLSYHIINCYVN